MAKGVVALLLILASCAPPSPGTRFTRFYRDVVASQQHVADSATAVDSAMAVATRHGISRDELVRVREKLHSDPERWVTVWTRVVEDPPAPRRSTPQ